MKKKVAVLLNSPYLGGAERSIIHQASLVEDNIELTFFVPRLDTSGGEVDDIVDYISRTSKAAIKYYHYPLKLFQVSRSGRFTSFLVLFFGILSLLYRYKKIKLLSYQTIWANGNKVGVVSFLFSLLFFFNGRFIWHFRDYPTFNSYFRLVWRLFYLPRKFQFYLVGNSYSVSDSLKKLATDDIRVLTLYNPVGVNLTNKRAIQTRKNIGVVSMMAPWKGVHQIVLWCSLFERELEKIGIDSVKIYGGDIYKTSGEHYGYLQQLRELHHNFPSKILSFEGLKEPSDIYNEVDIIIHPSIRKEPFGRIIIEAFAAGVPVISTCLGGAGELVEDEKTGLRFFSYDYHGLYETVKKIVSDEDYRQSLCRNAFQRFENIQGTIKNNIELLLDIVP